MPEYTIQDAETGRELVVEGATPPTPEDMAFLFAEAYRREGVTPPPSDLVAPPDILPPVEEVVPDVIPEALPEAVSQPVDPEDELGMLGTFTGATSRGFSRLGSTFTDIIPAIAGSAVGNEEYALEQLAEAEEKRRLSELEHPTQFESYKEVEGVGDFSRFVSQVVGEQIGNIALVVGTGIAAVATAPVSVPAGTALIAGTALGSYALNAPEVFENIYRETGETAPGVALLFGAGAAALDSVLPYGISRTLSPQFKSGIVKTLLERSGMTPGVLRSGTAGFFAGLGVEGITEGGQEAISIAAERFVDDNPEAFGSREWDRIMESVVQGAIAGGTFGGVGGGIQGVRESNDAKTVQAKIKIAKDIEGAPPPPVTDSTGAPLVGLGEVEVDDTPDPLVQARRDASDGLTDDQVNANADLYTDPEERQEYLDEVERVREGIPPEATTDTTTPIDPETGEPVVEAEAAVVEKGTTWEEGKDAENVAAAEKRRQEFEDLKAEPVDTSFDFGANVEAETVDEAAPSPRETFYHVTPVDNVPAIEQTGLRVRTEEGGTFTTLGGETPKQIYAFSDKGEADRWAFKMSYDLNMPIENLKIVSFESEVGNVQKDMNIEMQLKYPSAIISNTDIPPSNIVEVALPGKAPLAKDLGSIPVKTLFDSAGNVLETPTDTGVIVEGEAAAAATPEDEIVPGAKKTSGVGDPAAQPNPIYAAMRNARQAIEYIKKNTTDKLFKNLANRLAPLMGNTKFVVVTDPETQIANPVVIDLFNSGDTQGVYEESSDTMYLHSEKGLTEEVILHEATHKGTVAKIKIFLNNDPTNVGLTNKEVAVLEKISDLRLEAYKVYKAKERAGALTQAEIKLYNAGAFTNLYEFVAYGRTNKAMQQFLNTSPGTDGKSTLFAQFVELLRQLFNIPASQKNAFMELVKASDTLMVPTDTATNAGKVLAAKKTGEAKEKRVNKLLQAIRNATGGARGMWSNMGKLMKETRDNGWSMDILKDRFGAMSVAVARNIAKVLTTTDITRWIGSVVPRVHNINRDIQNFIKQRNIALAKLYEDIKPWVAFRKATAEGAQKLADLMHAARLAQVDPDEYSTAEESIANDGQLNGDEDFSPDDPNTFEGLIARANEVGISNSVRARREARVEQRKQEIRNMYASWEELGTYENGKGQEVYRIARDAYKATFDKYQALLLEHIRNTSENLVTQEKLINSITREYQKANRLKVYFPLMRYGNFWFAFGKGKNMRFEMFESATERNTAVRKFVEDRQTGDDTRSQTEMESDGDLRSGDELSQGFNELGANTEELKKIFDLIDNAELKTPQDIIMLKDEVYRLYLMNLPPGALRAKFLPSKNYAGFSPDALRNFITSQYNSANQLARFEFNPQLAKSIQTAKDSIKNMPTEEGGLKYQALLREIISRAEAELNPVIPEGFDFGRLASLGNQIAFVYMLSAPKSALIQFTQVPIIGMPALIARGYSKRSISRIFGGYLLVLNRLGVGDEVSIINSKYIDEHADSEQLKAGFQAAKELGILNVTYSADLSGRKKSPSDRFDSPGKKGWRFFVDAMGFLFHHSERLSREIMFMSSLELELERLKNTRPDLSAAEAVDAAVEKAVEITYETLFNYTLYEKPPLMKHPVGKIATQFLTYPLQMTSFLVRNFFGTVWPTIPKAERKAAATKLFGTIGMTSLFAGLVGIPGYTAIMGVAEGVREALRPDEDDEDADIWYDENDEGNPLGKRSLDLWFREWWIPTMFGPDSDIASALGLTEKQAQLLARNVEMGPISALTDKNIGSSVTLDHLWFQDRVPSEDMKSAFQYFLFDTFGGPLGAMAENIVSGIDDMNEGNFDRGWEKFAPAFFRGPLKAHRLRKEGSITQGQRAQILDAEFYTMGKILGQALNFQSTTEAEISKANFLAKRVMVEVQRERTKVLNQINLAYAKDMENSTPRTQANINEALDAVYEYNYRNGFYPIDGDSITQSLTGRATTRAEAEQGLVVPQKDLAPWAADLVRRSRVN